MGVTNTHHWQLVAGIAISGPDGNQGTLTGLATRDSDGEKVLVANLHVVSPNGWAVSGGELIYQIAVNNSDRVGRLLAGGWVPALSGQDNIADGAICGLENGVDAEPPSAHP